MFAEMTIAEAPRLSAAPAGGASTPTSGFLQVLGKRLDGLGWQHRVLASPGAAGRDGGACGSTRRRRPRRARPAGLDLPREALRATARGSGVIVCTGQSSVAQRVRGLRLGADDWVTKPCHPEELIARIEAVVRRRKRADARVEYGPVVDRRGRDPRRPVPGLRRRRVASSSPGASSSSSSCWPSADGQVLQREEIYQRVWGYAMVHGDRSVDVFVRKLRQKLERASPALALHPHPLRHRLPVRRPAGRRKRRAGEAVLAPAGAGAPGGGRRDRAGVACGGVSVGSRHIDRDPASTRAPATTPGQP